MSHAPSPILPPQGDPGRPRRGRTEGVVEAWNDEDDLGQLLEGLAPS